MVGSWGVLAGQDCLEDVKVIVDSMTGSFVVCFAASYRI